jgi:hypothetical protein
MKTRSKIRYNSLLGVFFLLLSPMDLILKVLQLLNMDFHQQLSRGLLGLRVGCIITLFLILGLPASWTDWFPWLSILHIASMGLYNL